MSTTSNVAPIGRSQNNYNGPSNYRSNKQHGDTPTNSIGGHGSFLQMPGTRTNAPGQTTASTNYGQNNNSNSNGGEYMQNFFNTKN